MVIFIEMRTKEFITKIVYIAQQRTIFTGKLASRSLQMYT